jgi:hypothetical protein
MLGQEKVLGELAATTVGVAPIAEGDCAVGMTRLSVVDHHKKTKKKKSGSDSGSDTSGVWEGEVLLRNALGAPVGRLVLCSQWKDVFKPRSEILTTRLNLDVAGIGLSIVGAADHCPRLDNYFGRELL